jgi:acetyl esterase/lipase
MLSFARKIQKQLHNKNIQSLSNQLSCRLTGMRLPELRQKLATFRVYDLGSIALNGLTPCKGYTVQHNLAYGLKARQRYDLYKSDRVGTKPLLIFVHGGAWSHGDKSAYKFVGEAFTREGYDVAVVNYHLAPSYKFPHYVDDLALLLNHLELQQQSLNISTQQIALIGHSAGAFNIASLLYHPKLSGLKHPERIQAMIGIAGPYHFDYKGDALAEHAFEIDVPYQEVMPYYFVQKNHIQHYLLMAENDQIVKASNSLDMADQLKAVGNHCELITIPRTGHISIMGSVSTLFSRFFQTKAEILKALEQSFQANKTD